jgi:nitroimidazol reductase NimA-like FMN-containing flavoprotein (pyridoxamine 5'-phosphate oxidase superfamily)
MRTYYIENRNEIDQIIRQCKTCHLALSDENIPYVVPMNFALDGNWVILHSAQEGRKWETMRKNPKACITWTLGEELAWQDVEVGCSYRVKSKTVLVEGTVEFVDDFEEKVRCLNLLMAQYSSREFKFNAPSVKNVGVLKVRIEKITAKEFGAKAMTPWNTK